MNPYQFRRVLAAAVLGVAGLWCTLPAHAGVFDFLFGKSAAEPAKPDARRRSWSVHEFTTVRLVPRERGAPPNEQPQQLDPELLRQLLSQLRLGPPSAGEPLFAADELAELLEPLAQALAVAGPDDDLLLLSTSRRGGGILAQPLGVTARLFVQGGALQIVVADTRLEFYNTYLGSKRLPEFTFGSRTQPGRATLRPVAGTVRRPDWVALSLAGGAAAAVAPAAAPAPAPPLATPAAMPAAAAATPAAPTAAPAARPRDAAFAEEIEQRLATLKRLRDRGLISEDEYQQKRREILALL